MAMNTRLLIRTMRQAPRILSSSRMVLSRSYLPSTAPVRSTPIVRVPPPQSATFHTSTSLFAQSPTADELMEDINDLYATARDEFEIAAEETEKKTVYASDDRDAAREALTKLKEAYEKASKESDPEVAKEVQSRVGPRIRELEHAVIAMEERAMEDH